jgi:hypothetical protein
MRITQKNNEEGYIEENVKPFDPVIFFLKHLHYWPYVLISVVLALNKGGRRWEFHSVNEFASTAKALQE